MSEDNEPHLSRRFSRVAMSAPVVCRTTQFPGMDVSGMIRNVGPGGVMAEFPVVLVTGSRAHLRFQTGRRSLAVEARVVWNAASADRTIHGLAFLTLQGPAFAEDLFLDEPR